MICGPSRSPDMKTLNVKRTGPRLLLPGVPATAVVKAVESSDAKPLRALTIHLAEIAFCRDALGQLAKLDATVHPTQAKALWVSALAAYYGCFGTDKAGTLLSAKKVLKPFPGAQAVFDKYQELYEKHRDRTENPYTNAFVGVVIHPDRADQKIADVLSAAVRTGPLDKKHIAAMAKLAGVTASRIEEQRVLIRQKLLDKYEAKDAKALAALDPFSFAVS
jgi:hypothetical protein